MRILSAGAVIGLMLATALFAADADEKSRHTSKIYKTYPEARTPGSQSPMRWDFSEGKLYEYSFHSESEMTMDSNLAGDAPKEAREPFRINADAKITVRSKQNHTADLVFQQSAAKGEFQDKSSMHMQQREPTVIQGMKEDGTMEMQLATGELFLQTLFPLPLKNLLPGEFADVPMSMPFNAGGSLLNVKGRNRITLKKYVVIDNRTYAELESDIQVSELDVPPELKGKYVCNLRGAAVFYFDVEARSFHSGRVALFTRIEMEAPTPKIEWSEEEKPSGFQMPEVTRMAMTSDQYYEIMRGPARP